jgi:FMN phosphatase YigB (HAD superfamily)
MSVLSRKTTLIFDLGGVIIDIDPKGTFERFKKYSANLGHPVWQQGLHFDLFKSYECGQIDDRSFLQTLQEIAGNTDLSESKLISLWNSMLLGIPLQRLQLVEKLKSHYRLLILSNTNQIHRVAFDTILKDTTGRQNFGHWFHGLYYSYEIGLRKPDPNIYKFVLEKEGLSAKETLFFDDNPENIQSAQSVGIDGVLVKHPDQLFDFFKNNRFEREA